MLKEKKVIVADLDGTLAASKSVLTKEMSDMIGRVLKNHTFVVVSGGALPQFQKQFLSALLCPPELLGNLYLFPTMGSTCYTYDQGSGQWKQVYEEALSDEERKKIFDAFNQTLEESGLDMSGPYGAILEDRGTQVTFSGRGQEAPIHVKNKWDPDQSKRRALVATLEKKIPEFQIAIGGSTSIDITRKGIDKAYAIGKIKEILKVTDDDIIFIGDALYPGGNDAAVKNTAVDFIEPSGPDQTLEFLEQYT
jgi:phosphomannomutase